MARTKPGTLKLAEDATGLHTEALLNPARSDVQILRAAIEDGAIDEMSFAFRVVRQRWSYLEDNGVIDRRWIQEVNLDKGDVSAVNFGANDLTSGLVAIRNRVFGGHPDERPPAGRRHSRAESDTGLLTLPDYTIGARAALMALQGKPSSSRTSRPTSNNDAVSEARRQLAEARLRSNR